MDRRMKKILAAWVTVLLTTTMCLTQTVEATANPPLSFDLDGDGKAEYLLTVEGWARGIKPAIEQQTFRNAVYTRYLYQSADRQTRFALTLVNTPHHDVLFFAKQDHAKVPVNTYITVQANETHLRHYYLTNLAKKEDESFEGKWETWQNVDSTAPLPQRPVYLQGDRLQARIGQVDVFVPQGYAVYRKTDDAIPVNRVLYPVDTRYQIRLPGTSRTISQTWGILSGQRLVNWDNAQSKDLTRKVDIDTFRKLLADGLYDVTPLSYTPSSPDSYFRNPANITGLRYVQDAADASLGSLTLDVLTHLAYTAVMNQNKDGYWQTYPRSNWLYRDYQIDYGYFDNRRNADNATFLLRYNRLFPDPAIADALRKWDRFLYRYIDETRLATSRQGALIPDYVDMENYRLSHTSLNHDLAVLNYLLESNLYAPDETRLKYIRMLLRGIEDTKARWLKPDFNFYYALYRNLKPHPYEDYFSLTLEDMKLTQVLLRKNHLPDSFAINDLIEKKTTWMKAQSASTAR